MEDDRLTTTTATIKQVIKLEFYAEIDSATRGKLVFKYEMEVQSKYQSTITRKIQQENKLKSIIRIILQNTIYFRTKIENTRKNKQGTKKQNIFFIIDMHVKTI